MHRFIFVLMLSFMGNLTAASQTLDVKDFLIRVTDSATGTYGYRDQTGKMVIPPGADQQGGGPQLR